AGLRNGIAALTASTSTDLLEAFYEDLAALLNAVGSVGGQGPYYIVMGAGRVGSIRARADALTDQLIATPAVGNDMIAVAAQALVAALSPDPDLETANAASLVLDDTAPVTPDTTQPTKSMFQTATIALKMRWPVTWALRDSRGVAWLTPTWK